MPGRFSKSDSEECKKMISVLFSGAVPDILLFFRKNHDAILTEKNIALRTVIELDSIRVDLDKLKNLGLLRSQRTGSQEWFTFNRKRDDQIQSQIKNYIQSFGETNRNL